MQNGGEAPKSAREIERVTFELQNVNTNFDPRGQLVLSRQDLQYIEAEAKNLQGIVRGMAKSNDGEEKSAAKAVLTNLDKLDSELENEIALKKLGSDVRVLLSVFGLSLDENKRVIPLEIKSQNKAQESFEKLAEKSEELNYLELRVKGNDLVLVTLNEDKEPTFIFSVNINLALTGKALIALALFLLKLRRKKKNLEMSRSTKLLIDSSTKKRLQVLVPDEILGPIELGHKRIKLLPFRRKTDPRMERMVLENLRIILNQD